MAYATWLADVLRGAQLKVIEQPGWEIRGHGPLGNLWGILCHHTAGPRNGNAPSLTTVEHGRPGLDGPLAQLVLGRDGTFFVVAAGKCWHAGPGSYAGLTAGNASLIGIEAENVGDGTDPWPAVQMDAYRRGVAAILNHLGLGADHVIGHREWTPRKIDPAFNMVEFRHEVDSILKGFDPPHYTLRSLSPEKVMLKIGDDGPAVTELQRKLRLEPDGVFGIITEIKLKFFQSAHGLKADGMAGPKTWAALDGSDFDPSK